MSTLAVTALWKREMIKFVRDRSRILGALAQPLGFWLLLGLGFKTSFQIPGANPTDVGYLEFLFPGIIAMILLFTAIFSTISVVEERKSGFLQAALVAPISRTSLVLGNILGGTSLALAEAALFLLLAPLIGFSLSLAGIAMILLASLCLSLAFTALGFIIAWRMDTTRGFHAVMNLFLLPLWFLSGSPFPVEGASPILRWLVALNPVTYAVSAIRQGLYWPGVVPSGTGGILLNLSVTVVLAVVLIGVATYTVRRPVYG